MSGASRSLAHPAMHIDVLCGQRWTFWSWRISFAISRNNVPSRIANGEKNLSWIDRLGHLMPQPTSRQQLRSFGFIVAGGFAVIGLWPWLFRGQQARVWPLTLAGVLALSAILAP